MTRPAGGALFALLLAACSTSASPPASPTARATVSTTLSPSPQAPGPVVLAAGDIAGCDSDGDEATAEMLDDLDGIILTLGDNAYPDGTADDFATCYDPSWGRLRSRTWPVPGNHEYETVGAAPYFAYFGAIAGDPAEGWYSFDLGDWHLIALNSNCDEIGGCDLDSSQADWLRADLAAQAAAGATGETACTLAYWHHPRWSSGDEHGSDPRTDALWRILSVAGAEVVLSGHDHEYERFVPMDADGDSSPEGLVQFVVGTGGRPLYEFATPLATSAARDNSTHGVLKLTLGPDGYDWEFVPASGSAFSDAGSADCR